MDSTAERGIKRKDPPAEQPDDDVPAAYVATAAPHVRVVLQLLMTQVCDCGFLSHVFLCFHVTAPPKRREQL